MGHKKQYQIGMKQRQKRKKKMAKLSKKQLDVKDFYYSGFYLKTGEK